MRRSSMSRWVALAVAVSACGLTAQPALAAFRPATSVNVQAECPILFWWCWLDPSPSPSPSAALAAAATASPTPTPDPTPAATPTPTATPSVPSPAPSGTPAPTPSASASATPPASATPAPTPTPSATPTPVPTRTALPAPGPAAAVLGSDAIQISGLRSLAVRTVSTAAGPMKVIELVANGSTITGLDLQGPCVAHTRVDTSAPTDVASGGLTLDATALQATILGVPIIIAAADLPEGALTLPGVTLPTLPTDLGFLTVKLFVLSIQSGAMSLQAPRITSSAC